MKRLFVEIFWFMIIGIILTVLGGLCFPVMFPDVDPKVLGRKLFGPIAILSLLITTILAKRGILPGTKKK